AAEAGAAGRARAGPGTPARRRRPPLTEREDLPEDRLRDRDDWPAAEALEHAREHQERQVGRDAREERADREQDRADQEEASAPEQAREPARRRDDDRVRGEEGRDDPR